MVRPFLFSLTVIKTFAFVLDAQGQSDVPANEGAVVLLRHDAAGEQLGM